MLNIIRLISRIVFFGFILYLIIRYFLKRRNSHSKTYSKRAVKAEMKKDPVCGLYISSADSKIVKSGGDIFYFCSDTCRDKFVELKAKNGKK